jgi:hypothetical protein
LKSRIGPKSAAVVFRIDTPKTHPQGLFDFVVTDEKFPSKESSAVDNAVADLENLLREGPRSVKEVTGLLSDLKYTEKIIRQARERVTDTKRVHNAWYWELKSSR